MTHNLFNRISCGGILIGLSLAAGLIISAAQVTRAWLHISDSQVISVTGSAYEEVTSDKATWSASFAAEGDKMDDALHKLKADAARVQSFLSQRGVTNAEISSINIQRLKPVSTQFSGDEQSKRTIGFRLSQTVSVESTNVRQVMDLQQQSSSLVGEGVELEDGGIQFIYSKTAGAKIEMLAAATRDARQRAEQIASQGGRKIRSLREARMGVFQITPRNSSATSAEGINDTSSKDKTIRAVVSASFTME
jgi:hypothetical protein